MSTVIVSNINSLTANTAPVIGDANGTQVGTFCRAWVNFDGTGTVAIRASFNVLSLSDDGNGSYTVNLQTPLPDANGSVVSNARAVGVGGSQCSAYVLSTTAIPVSTYPVGSGTLTDTNNIHIAVFR